MIFAAVLFFGGIAGKFRSQVIDLLMLALARVVFVAGVEFLLTLPIVYRLDSQGLEISMIRERLSPVDTVLLRTEHPTNPMTVTVVMVFGAPVDFDRLRETIESRLLCFDRFRRRVVQPRLPWGSPYWEDDPGFDLGYHLQRVALPPPGGQSALQELVSLLASTPLDPSRPLWQLHLVENYGDGSTMSLQARSVAGGCALICRLHHSLADGVALVHLLFSLADPDPQATSPDTAPENRGPRSPSRRGTLPAATSLVRKGLGVLAHPWRVADLAQLGYEAAITLGELALLPPDPDTLFRGKLGVTKRAAWSAPVRLADVKTIGRRLGGTVNDVLLAAMTGALRRYLGEGEESLDGASLRAAVPVDLRPPGTKGELGNRIGFVFLSLPVGIADPAGRLCEIKRRMDGHKDSLEAPLSLAMMKVIGVIPSSVQDVLVNFLGTKATVLMTNVIGPRERLYLAGAPLETLMFWVPQAGGVGVGVSILSYAGRVRLGVLTDAGLVPDPEVVIAGFHAEFDAMLSVALSRSPVGHPRHLRWRGG